MLLGGVDATVVGNVVVVNGGRGTVLMQSPGQVCVGKQKEPDEQPFSFEGKPT